MHGRNNRQRQRGNNEYSIDDHSSVPTLLNFPGSALVDAALLQCGNLTDSGSFDDNNHKYRSKSSSSNKSLACQLLSSAQQCVMSPTNSMQDELAEKSNDSTHTNSIIVNDGDESTISCLERTKKEKDNFDNEYEEFGTRKEKKKTNNNNNNNATTNINNNIDPSSPPRTKEQQQKKSTTTTTATTPSSGGILLAKALSTELNRSMTPAAMVEREKKLLKAQEKARQHNLENTIRNHGRRNGASSPSSMSSSGVGGHCGGSGPSSSGKHAGKYMVTIGLSLSRRSSALGHPDTVTRQTAFDFNELQDRDYKYVSSTDSSGWRAGGGERGGAAGTGLGGGFFSEEGEDENDNIATTTTTTNSTDPGTPNGQDKHKVAAPDTVHIPIIHIDAGSPQVVDAIVSALARGEIFIPHMAILPEALSVNGVSPPNLVVRFGTERNEDIPPDDWPNWCLEFMHNQLYEYFYEMGARWMKRPFSITLAKKVRWKTVKHMNRYFAHAERVIDAWREKGPQYLDPQLAYIEGGATPEEVGHSHGIYLLRNGIPTNYFAPNFDPPYTTKMTRSLLLNVLGKSWDKKRREWTSTPIPKLITPSMLVTAMCGCADTNPANIGFMATEATTVSHRSDRSTMVPDDTAIRSITPAASAEKKKNKNKKERKQQQQEMKDTNTVPTTAANVVQLTPLLSNDMYRMRTTGTEQETTAPNVHPQQQQQQQVRPKPHPEQVRLPNNNNNQETGAPASEQLQFEGKLQLQISSSSASFFDNNSEEEDDVSGIPSPKVAALQQEMEAAATAVVAAAKKQEQEQQQESFEQQQRQQHSNPLQVRVARGGAGGRGEGEGYQEKKEQPWKSSPENDENSGDSKNQRDPVFEGQRIDNHNHNNNNNKQQHQQQQQHSSSSTSNNYQKQDTAAAMMTSDEDWLNNLGKPLPNEKRSKDPIGSTLCDTFRDSTLSPTVRSKNSRSLSRNVHVNATIVAPLSMDYSKDDTLFTNGGDTMSVGELTNDSKSMLFGQPYTSDSSTIASKTTNEPPSSVRDAVDPQQQQQTQQQHSSPGVNVMSHPYMAEQSYLQGVQEGNRSAETTEEDDEEENTMYEDEVAPSDDVLFAAGWAKTLDPNSGSYYYFTLDRTKTVWDNPLAPTPTQSYEDEEDDDEYSGSI